MPGLSLQDVAGEYVVVHDQPPSPPTPTITQDGNTLHSVATEGNQWYNQNGIIESATDQD